MIGTEIVGLECQRQVTFEISKQIHFPLNHLKVFFTAC